MSEWHEFRWQGKPIVNIEVWCEEHGDRMVEGERHRSFVGAMSGKMIVQRERFRMPESFFNRLTDTEGWIYELEEPHE